MNSSLILYIGIALTASISQFLGTDESGKYISPEILFWARGVNGILSGVFITLKGYLSQGFQEWLKKKAATNGSIDSTKS